MKLLFSYFKVVEYQQFYMVSPNKLWLNTVSLKLRRNHCSNLILDFYPRYNKLAFKKKNLSFLVT